MESLIQVFRMTEVSAATRIRILFQLGNALNYQMGGNVTEELVVELVLALDPDYVFDEHYSGYAKALQQRNQQ